MVWLINILKWVALSTVTTETTRHKSLGGCAAEAKCKKIFQ